MPVQNAEFAAMFDQAAELLEIQGENQFRVRAYLPQSVVSQSRFAPRDQGRAPASPQRIGPDIERKLAVALDKPAAQKRFKLAVSEAGAEALVAFLKNGGFYA